MYGDLIPEEFYQRDTVTVARELLGKHMIHHLPAGPVGGVVVETEAYLGPGDPASHSARGKTKRNAVMFGPAACAYVYKIYGIHFCFNVTCDSPVKPAAILIRAIEPKIGIEIMTRLRNTDRLTNLCSGPGKLAQAMDINLDINGTSVVTGPVRFYYANQDPGEIVVAKRIGISQAEHLPLRFYIANNRFVSRK